MTTTIATITIEKEIVFLPIRRYLRIWFHALCFLFLRNHVRSPYPLKRLPRFMLRRENSSVGIANQILPVQYQYIITEFTQDTKNRKTVFLLKTIMITSHIQYAQFPILFPPPPNTPPPARRVPTPQHVPGAATPHGTRTPRTSVSPDDTVPRTG